MIFMGNINSGIISGSISPNKVVFGNVTNGLPVNGEINASFLKGEQGERPQLRVDNNILQYRYEDTEWIDLINIREVYLDIIENDPDKVFLYEEEGE